VQKQRLQPKRNHQPQPQRPYRAAHLAALALSPQGWRRGLGEGPAVKLAPAQGSCRRQTLRVDQADWCNSLCSSHPTITFCPCSKLCSRDMEHIMHLCTVFQNGRPHFRHGQCRRHSPARWSQAPPLSRQASTRNQREVQAAPRYRHPLKTSTRTTATATGKFRWRGSAFMACPRLSASPT
jgi:hypothetical protein